MYLFCSFFSELYIFQFSFIFLLATYMNYINISTIRCVKHP